MVEHTKLPWHASRKATFVSDISNRTIAEMHGTASEREANAIFIAAACNAYDALLRRVVVLERIILEEVNPFTCRDDLNQMIVDEIFKRTPAVPSEQRG